jgi:hypothetical protein
MNKLFIYILFFCAVNLFSQIPVDTEVKLDSVINAKNSSHKVKYIYIIDHTVILDSLTIKKVRSTKLDSTIVIIYSNKTQKRISATEFWGVIPDYGDCRRFYNGKTFPIYKPVAPYFYKITKKSSSHYYFSETLTGKIHPLNLRSVNKYVLDVDTKSKLAIYIKEQAAKNTKNKAADVEHYNALDEEDMYLSRMVEGSVKLTLFVIDVINGIRK